MPERGDGETFSNPLPPTKLLASPTMDDEHPMTNDDFRRLMMTPRAPSSSKSLEEDFKQPNAAFKPTEEDDPAMLRKKKKSFYAKLKKIEEEREKELAEKYRDRARERRDGSNKDYEETEIISTTADYRAVAPDAKAGENYAERRKQLIQESKYLGGDMEHTHLVKGLDYALLDKVRAEITTKESEDMELEEMIKEDLKIEKMEKEDVPVAVVPEEEQPQVQLKTKLAKNIYRLLFQRKIPAQNEMFLPRRMAYSVDLEDEYAVSDIPNTMIRSKAECPSLEATTTMTTNDIVINKLTQILSYLRQGRKDKKMKKRDKGRLREELDRQRLGEDGIFGEVGNYVPAPSKGRDKERKDRERRDREGERDRERDRDDRHRDRRDREDRRDRDDRRDRERGGGRDRDRERADRDKKKSYFEKPSEEDDQDRVPDGVKELVNSINEKFSKGWAPADLERESALRSEMEAVDKPPPAKKTKEDERMKKLKNKTEIDSYAECYPGMMESADALGDSDDEADYTKMDQGNKKGPIGRWDFDTQEEYSDYMSNKEALPKAAFQYGVKMSDGRKTRRAGPKDEKRELDREWQKIQNMIAKRKHMGTGGPSSKAPKY